MKNARRMSNQISTLEFRMHHHLHFEIFLLGRSSRKYWHPNCRSLCYCCNNWLWVVEMMHSSKLFGLGEKVHKCPWCMNDCLPWDNVHHVTCTIVWLYGLDNTWGDSSEHFSTKSIPTFSNCLNLPSALLQGLKMAAFLSKCTIALHYNTYL